MTAIDLDNATDLEKYYKVLLIIDNQYKQLLDAQEELQWYEEKFREASNYVALEVPNDTQTSLNLSRHTTESALNQGKQQYEKSEAFKKQLVEMESQHQQQLKATEMKYFNRLREIQSRLDQLEDVSRRRVQISKESDESKIQVVWRCVLLFGVPILALLIFQNPWVLLIAALIMIVREAN